MFNLVKHLQCSLFPSLHTHTHTHCCLDKEKDWTFFFTTLKSCRAIYIHFILCRKEFSCEFSRIHNTFFSLVIRKTCNFFSQFYVFAAVATQHTTIELTRHLFISIILFYWNFFLTVNNVDAIVVVHSNFEIPLPTKPENKNAINILKWKIYGS